MGSTTERKREIYITARKTDILPSISKGWILPKNSPFGVFWYILTASEGNLGLPWKVYWFVAFIADIIRRVWSPHKKAPHSAAQFQNSACQSEIRLLFNNQQAIKLDLCARVSVHDLHYNLAISAIPLRFSFSLFWMWYGSDYGVVYFSKRVWMLVLLPRRSHTVSLRII